MKYIAALSSLLILLLSACKPSEEESTSKISRTWQINKYYENNNDLTAAFKSNNKNYTIQFFTDHTFIQSAIVNDTFKTNSGAWDFNEDLDSLFVYGNVDTNRYFIRLLRIKNLNIREVISATTHDYLMVDY